MAEKQTSKDRMREIVDSIENGIKELFESDKYRKYLATMSRFHRYSVNNTMLIYMQRPDATHVAGFNKWRDQFGRNVLKGEKGIRIIAPTPYKKKVEEIKTDPETNAPMLDADGKAIIEEKEIRIPMFKVVSVFDVSQTAGKPLPQLAADLSGNVQQYEVFMEALRRASPVPIGIKPVAHDTDGFFSIKAQSITIRAGMSEVQTVCAAVHEIAHAKLHDYEHMTELADDGETILVPGEKSRNTEEVEAESISYDQGGWRATWDGEGGGVLLNQNPHNLDLWQWMCGIPKRVKSQVYYGKHRNIEVEDDLYALVEYENGATGCYITTVGDAPGTNRLEIDGTNGKIVVENNELTFYRLRIPEPEFNATYKGGLGKPEVWECKIPIKGTYTSHPGIINNFCDCILKGAKPIAPGAEGIRGLQISNAIHLSSWLNGEWVDIPVNGDLFLEKLQEHCKEPVTK